MRAIWTSAVAVTFLVCVGFVLGVLASISLHDVPASYELTNRPLSGAQAGDLHAVSSDGLRSDRLCQLELREDARDERVINRLYINVFAEKLPFAAKLLPGGADADEVADDGTLHFVGEYTELRERPIRKIPTDCEAAVLESYMLREKLCLVDQSLTPINAGVAFSAYRYSTRQVILSESFFDRHDAERPDWAEAHGALECPPVPQPDWPILVRRSLGLVIDRAPSQTGQSAPSSVEADLAPAFSARETES